MSAGRSSTLAKDLAAGLVVFLVAVPLSLGIALASGAPLISGLVAGVVGGVVVGVASGSHTSVSGPAAGLAAIVFAQLAVLPFDAFLLAVVLAGLLQVVLGLARAGALASFVSTSVIKGLLAAIGLVLVIEQIPYLLGHDIAPAGVDDFDALLATITAPHLGAAAIGLSSIVLLVVWRRWKPFESARFSAPLAVVLWGLALTLAFEQLGAPWEIGASHLVQVPLVQDVGGVLGLFRAPDLSAWNNPQVSTAALTIAAVASLETLLNLEATDRIDSQQRVSPPNRELVAQGVGNVVSGLLGGLPVTSVIARSSLNIYSGAATKRATITQGALLCGSVLLLPTWLNRIPLACLAAILVVTGARLASPQLLRQMLAASRDQRVPFVATVLGIVFTNTLAGLAIGIGVSLAFILRRHSRRSLHGISERHVGGEVLRIELPLQVTFLNQTTLQRALDAVPRDSQLLLDAGGTEYIDPDVLAMLREYRDVTAPARGVQLSMAGFHESYQLRDDIRFVDHSTRELQQRSTPSQVLEILRDGNTRFFEGRQLNRDLARQVGATARGQHPLAVVLGCIDSRTPTELVFDMGVGDVFSVRIAGNVLGDKILGSMEYGCAVAGAKLVVVMGHTRCGAVAAAVDLYGGERSVAAATGCEHLHHIIEDIQHEVDRDACARALAMPAAEKAAFVTDVARRNVRAVVKRIVADSSTMRTLVEERRIAIVGVLYDVSTGKMEFMLDDAIGLARADVAVG